VDTKGHIHYNYCQLKTAIIKNCYCYCLQCFDTVGLVTGRVSGLQKLLLQNSLGQQLCKLVGYSPKYPVDANCFGQSCEDAQDNDDWRLRIVVDWWLDWIE